jgi:predicted RNase H-like nuclease (RuvC/YqgF family)
MEESFDLLEGRIRKAAELVQNLRAENAKLTAELEKARRRATDLEKRSESAAPRAGAEADKRRIEELTKELDERRHERDEVRKRVQRLLEVLEQLD